MTKKDPYDTEELLSDVNKLGSGVLKTFGRRKSRGRGWHNDRYEHALAGSGIKTRYKVRGRKYNNSTIEGKVLNADTLEEKISILNKIKEKFPNMYGYYSRVHLPHNEIDDERKINHWIDTIKNEIERFSEYNNPLKTAEKSHKNYQNAVEETNQEEWDNIHDEAYIDAKEYLQSGRDLEEILSIEDYDDKVPSPPDLPLKVPYVIGWNNAVQDFEKGKDLDEKLKKLKKYRNLGKK